MRYLTQSVQTVFTVRCLAGVALSQMFLTQHALPVCLAIALPLGGGFLSNLPNRNVPKESWYQNLKKPSFNPPNYVFPIAWTTLYTTMGVASYLVFRDYVKPADTPMICHPLVSYGVQLGLNFAWSFLFFGKKMLFESALECTALLAAVVVTTVKFYNASKLAGLLMIPYLGWSAFATLLTWKIYKLNCKNGSCHKKEHQHEKEETKPLVAEESTPQKPVRSENTPSSSSTSAHSSPSKHHNNGNSKRR